MTNVRRARGLGVVALVACLATAAFGGIATAGQTNGSGGEAIATLKIDSANVEVQKAGADTFKKAKDGQKLREGDTVRTDATGSAEIDYGSDAYTRLDVNTTFTVVSLTDDQGNREVKGSLEQGRTWNRTVALTESESFEQEGGGATAAVQGTAFAVDCQTADHCDFTAIVDVTTLTGADGVVKLLQPLDQCDSTSGVLCGDITKISPEDLPDWITKNLLRDLVERGLDDGGLRGTLVIEDDGTVVFVPAGPVTEGESVEAPEETTTTTQPDTSTAPSPPTGVGALPGWEAATVSWTPGSDGGSPITGYTVTATPISSASVLAAVTAGSGGCTATPPATSCTVTGLSNDTTYSFTVTATNKKGTSAASQPSNEVTPPIVIPSGAQYQYTTTDPGTGFELPDFDDSGWETGDAPFASIVQQDCNGTDAFPPGASPFPVGGDLWVRITFELPEGASGLQITGSIDNVAQFFVNGYDAGQYSGGSCSKGDIDIAVDDAWLIPGGSNVIAVHASDQGIQSFLDFTVRYTDPNGETAEAATTQSSGSGTTTTSSTTTSSTSSTTSTTVTTAPPATDEPADPPPGE